MPQELSSPRDQHGGGPADALPSAAGQNRPIRFWHRGQLQQIEGLPSTLTVLQWLREHQGCTGTKEGCNEGDCGACTVLVAKLDSGGALDIKPQNSCLMLLPTLDGKALVTVEDLGGLHPAQQAMVATHGSQCGFCTPGFVMSLAACYARHVGEHPQAETSPPSRAQLADDLSGNLCRCTGYRPILDAGQQMFTLPRQGVLGPGLPTAPIVQALAGLANDPPLSMAGTGITSTDKASATAFSAPRQLQDLAEQFAAHPQARLLSGNTDIGLWLNKQFRQIDALIYLGEVAELKAISVQNGWLRIGAGASLQAAWAALAQHWPELRQMGLRFASWPVREGGTLGGNLANGSPIGDGAPVLMALGALLLLRRGDTTRQVALETFYLGYQRNQLAAGEFLQEILAPLPEANTRDTTHVRAYKLSQRFDSDISALACGLFLRVQGGLIAEARLAFGGMAATVQRAQRTEAALRDQRWTEATLQAAQAALAQDFAPLTDLRASAAHRQRAAQNLLRRFWLETRPDTPLRAEQVSVWDQP